MRDLIWPAVDAIWNSLAVPLSTCEHLIDEYEPRERIDADAEITTQHGDKLVCAPRFAPPR